MRARKNIYKNMCHKCHVSYSNANLGTASSLLERSAEAQLIFYKNSKFFGTIQRILREKSLEDRNFIVVAILPSCVSTTFAVLVA